MTLDPIAFQQHDPTRAASLGSLHVLPDSVTIESILTLLSPKDLLLLALTSRYLNVFARNDYVWKRLFFDHRNRSATRIVFRGSWFLTYLFPTPDHDEACLNHPLVKHPVPVQETFDRRYRYPNRPLMIQRSGVEQWPAWEQWSLDALASKYGETQFRVSNIESDEEPSFGMCFQDFLHYIRYNNDTDPLYLFDPYFAETVPDMDSAYKVPKYFEFDYFSLLKSDIRPPYRWLLVGPQRTGAPWHVDPSGTSGHDPTSSERKTSVSWYLDVYPYLPPESLPLEIVQNPGQTIYVPSGWWHMVINMDDTVAVTHNFADEANLLQVKRSMLGDDKETTQLKRWELLEKEICDRRPDLIPALTCRSEHQLIPGLIDKGPWFDVDSPESLSTWQARAQQVLQRVGVVSNLDDIEPVLSGRNICFLTEDAFVKFFTPYQDGPPCFSAEVAANRLLMDDHESNGQHVLSSPKMLGHGYWQESDHATVEGVSEWRWPYIVTETALDMPLFDALDYLPLQQVDEGFLAPLMDGLQYYHTLNLDKNAISSKILSLSSTAIPLRLQSAAQNHARWRLFPKHLLDQLSDYLPIVHAQVFNPASSSPLLQQGRADMSASLVHGDVNPSNILGILSSSPSYFSDGIDVSYGQSKETPELLPAHAEFKPTTMIDYGDALFKSDPLIDYVSVFITILNSRRDQPVIDVLLNSWRNLVKVNNNNNNNNYNNDSPQKRAAKGEQEVSLARRCMWHVLLWPSEGLTLHLTQCVPEIGEMKTWHDVEEALFGWWSAL
ncbi:hypothetical protein BGZ95_006274 [Linnemannia exigua]|uniref:JmjC domain-containing protein n=1 Tax=Linnemannia exigua TaxID=604196 RepID=A0AAD4H8Q7_9FUNG|nr:hypothetical protein BGZ95_006274 [Linnemannia exigua]